jgi:hypothetical protein
MLAVHFVVMFLKECEYDGFIRIFQSTAFSLFWCVKRHNFWICGNASGYCRFSDFCAVSRQNVFWGYSICRRHFDWCSVHKNVLADVFQKFVMPFLEEEAPLHLHIAAQQGKAAASLHLVPRSSRLTPRDFFFREYTKGDVFVSLLPATFHSCGSSFLMNVTLKSTTFHAFTLYNPLIRV